MIETFGLKGLADKPFFPYLFNTQKNLGTRLTHLPARETYLPNSMSPKTKEKFDQWYAENYHQSFALSEQLASYCMNDVEILTHAVVHMKTLFLFEEVTSIDIVQQNTIAAACMKSFRTNEFTEGKKLALISEKGYGLDKNFNQSDLARKFIRWFVAENNISDFDDCETVKGEKRIGEYRVDCYIPSVDRTGRKQLINIPGCPNEKDLVIEVHGCYHHACSKCYPDENSIVIGNKTAGFIREKNQLREQKLREFGERDGFELIIKWEW